MRMAELYSGERSMIKFRNSSVAMQHIDESYWTEPMYIIIFTPQEVVNFSKLLGYPVDLPVDLQEAEAILDFLVEEYDPYIGMSLTVLSEAIDQFRLTQEIE